MLALARVSDWTLFGGRRMDLNLHLGLPRSPPPRRRDLGSDLSLSSLPPRPSPSTTVEDGRAPIPMSGAVEPSESHPPHANSQAEYGPELPVVLPSDRVYTPEYASCFAPIQPVVGDPEGTDAPYSPIRVEHLPALQEPGEAYLPPFVRGSANHQDHGAATFSFYPSITVQTGESLRPADGPSSRTGPSCYPDLCFSRLMQSSNRWPNRRFRSSLPHSGERLSFGSSLLPNPEQRVPDIVSSQRPSECNDKHKLIAENKAMEASEDEREDKSKSAANFECNICFDMAAEPVVTSCGHLFCWPCLYQWLHIHSDHKECPVCKGEVTEPKIIPIYGRGSSQTGVEKKNGEDAESAVKIPPRPHGNRFESFRQQVWSVSRRLDEGIAASWRRILDQQIRTGNRYGAFADPSQQDIYDSVHGRALIRLRMRRMSREVNPESGSVTGELGLPVNNMPTPIASNTDSIFQDGARHQFSMYDVGRDRSAAITANFGRVVGQFTSSGNGYGASTSSVDPPNSSPFVSGPRVESALAADQASASSTMADIQGDVASSDALAEPYNAGSSWFNMRRGRSSTSGSFDADGGVLDSSKRRRLN